MKAPARDGRYAVQALNRGHDRAAFTCGVEALDRYLRQQALQDARRGFAAVFVALARAQSEILGYYAVSMGGVALDLVPEEIRRRMPRYPSVPAIRLGRLAVATAAQGRGLGTFLLMDAMQRGLRSEVAWAAFLVDAKDERAGEFYRRFGFQPFVEDARHLYLMRPTIEGIFRE